MIRQVKIHTLTSKLCSFSIVIALLYLTFGGMLTSCKDASQKDIAPEEDTQAKKKAQGVWVDEEDGNVVFRIDGDTLYYPDNMGEPASFYILNDTLYLNTSKPVRYQIKQLTQNAFRFINPDGDEVSLLRSNSKSDLAHFIHKNRKETQINQGQLIKRDTVMTIGDIRYHAYVQVNPTSYKVMKQNLTEDGLSMDNAYYDNIIHVSLYDGATKIYSHDIRKTDFAKQVPSEYLEHSILSDILIKQATPDGVIFETIITEPESYTSYHVNLTITHEGKVSMSYE